MNGKCPKCGMVIKSLKADTLDALFPNGDGLKALVLLCPNAGCAAVLGAQVDPIAVKDDIVNELFDRLRKPEL